MGSWQPVANLRDFFSQHPPGVTFFLCLLTLALSLFFFSSYSHTHTLANPDTTQDWNQFLASVSRLQLCTTANVTAAEPGYLVTTPLIGEKTGGTPLANSSQGLFAYLSLQVPLALTQRSAGRPLGDLGLHTSLLAHQLGLTGDEVVNVTIRVFSQPAGGGPLTCLTLTAPAHILPPTPLPPECPANEKMVSPVSVVAMEMTSQKPLVTQTCYSLQSTFDPAFTAMLTQEQQGVAEQHLLEVSVCLLGVCLLMCLSASFTQSHTRRYHSNGLDLHRVSRYDVITGASNRLLNLPTTLCRTWREEERMVVQRMKEGGKEAQLDEEKMDELLSEGL